jgi:hypothetical protein
MPRHLRKVARILDALRRAVKENRF